MDDTRFELDQERKDKIIENVRKNSLRADQSNDLPIFTTCEMKKGGKKKKKKKYNIQIKQSSSPKPEEDEDEEESNEDSRRKLSEDKYEQIGKFLKEQDKQQPPALKPLLIPSVNVEEVTDIKNYYSEEFETETETETPSVETPSLKQKKRVSFNEAKNEEKYPDENYQQEIQTNKTQKNKTIKTKTTKTKTGKKEVKRMKK